MRLMKPIALALLFVLLPTAVFAQSPAQPQKSSGKLKWIGLSSVLAGAGLAVAAFSGGRTDPAKSAVTAVPSVITTVSTCTQVVCVSTIPVAPTGVTGTPVGGSGPLALPGTNSGAFGVPTTTVTLQPQYQHKTNWKLITPAIAASSAGGFLLYRYHVRGKSADVSLRQDGAVQFAIRW